MVSKLFGSIMKKNLLLTIFVFIGINGFVCGALKKDEPSSNLIALGNQLPLELQNIIIEFCYGNLSKKALYSMLEKLKRNKDFNPKELYLIENILASRSSLDFFATDDSESCYTTHINIKLLKELLPMLGIHNNFFEFSRGRNNLLCACFLGLPHVVDNLLAMGTRLDAEDKRGNGPLHFAVINNQNEILCKLITAGADLNSQTAFSLTTPLHLAAWKNNIPAARLLIDAGANINAKDIRHERPLHAAARMGNVAMVQLLLDKGAKVDAESTTKATALHYATYFGHDEVVVLLLNHGANPEARTDSSGTSLHVAAYLGLDDIVATLIEKHVNVDTITNNGITPLDLAARNNHVNVIHTLMLAGANPLLQDTSGFNALDYAASRHNQEALQALNHDIHAMVL